jgi:two-component system, CitB family, response regulator
MKLIETLIVEDDKKIAEIQHLFLEKIDGFAVVGIAHSISEAEEIIGILKPDLVLLDIYFPEGNGIDLLWKIRSDFRMTDVILITAAKEIRILQEAVRGGVFDYILKPVVFNRFQNTMIKFLEHRQSMSGITTVNQQDVDRLLRPEYKETLTEEDMPKGIDPITLEKITEVMEHHKAEGINAEKVGEKVGVSRTTARRYLEYLVSNGIIIADLSYGAVGRPERIYLKNV